MEHEEIVKMLGYPGKMISGSKSGYIHLYPKNLTIFNANVIINNEKIWYGDIDITLSKETLIELALFYNEDLYILYEMDARFENETSPVITRFVAKFLKDGTIQLGVDTKKYYDEKTLFKL